MENIGLNTFATPLIVALIVISLVIIMIRVLRSEDGGKGIIKSFQKNKIGISEITLFALGFMEAVVAGESHEGTASQYAIRMGIHILIAWVGAFVGSIAFRELADAYYKTAYEKHSIGYIFVQWFQGLFALALGLMVPFFNLIIIAKGLEELNVLRGLIPNGDQIYQAGLIERFDYSDGNTLVSSTVMVILHILLTIGIALWSLDDVEAPKEEKKPEVEDDKEKPKPKAIPAQEAVDIMATSLSLNKADLLVQLNSVKSDAKKNEYYSSMRAYGSWFNHHQEKLDEARSKKDQSKIDKHKNGLKKTASNFEQLWAKIQEEDKTNK